jgi:surfactin synthase thioesterase subunit
VPTAELRYFDGGHFVLDEYADAIAEAIIETFSRSEIAAYGKEVEAMTWQPR